MRGAGLAGWVALGVSTMLGVCCAAFIFGYLVGRGHLLGAAIVACVAVWLVSVVVGGLKAAEPWR